MKSVFRKSTDKFIIEEVASVLDVHSINYEIISNEKDFNPSFITDTNKIEYQLLIDKDDYSVAEIAVSQYYVQETSIPEGYYLSEYSNDELREILSKKDEWNEFDYGIANKILNERGENITEEELTSINKRRLDALRDDYENPQEVKNYIIIGYIFAIVGCIVSLVWGMLIFVSYAIAIAMIKLRKHLPSGESVYYFNEKDRRHGKRILILSLTFTVIWISIIITKFM